MAESDDSTETHDTIDGERLTTCRLHLLHRRHNMEFILGSEIRSPSNPAPVEPDFLPDTLTPSGAQFPSVAHRAVRAGRLYPTPSFLYALNHYDDPFAELDRLFTEADTIHNTLQNYKFSFKPSPLTPYCPNHTGTLEITTAHDILRRHRTVSSLPPIILKGTHLRFSTADLRIGPSDAHPNTLVECKRQLRYLAICTIPELFCRGPFDKTTRRIMRHGMDLEPHVTVTLPSDYDFRDYSIDPAIEQMINEDCHISEERNRFYLDCLIYDPTSKTRETLTRYGRLLRQDIIDKSPYRYSLCRDPNINCINLTPATPFNYREDGWEDFDDFYRIDLTKNTGSYDKLKGRLCISGSSST